MKSLFTKTPLLLAASVLFSSAASAASDAEVNALRDAVKALQAEVEKLKVQSATAPSAPAPAPAIPENLDRRLMAAEMKLDDIKAADVEGGALSGLSVTGYIDMLYSVNPARDSNGLVFLNTTNSYGYDTSNRGDVFLDIKKSFGTGPMAPSAEITIMPTRGIGRGLSFNDQGSNNQSLINTAQVNYPVSPSKVIFGGAMNSFAGYEFQTANTSPLISHNLLFDFSEPGAVTGIGFSDWTGTTDIFAWRALIGNAFNQSSPLNTTTARNQAPMLAGRVDYQFNSSSDIGVSAFVGKNSPVNYVQAFPLSGSSTLPASQSENFFYTEADYSYTGLDSSWFAQFDYGQNDHAAANGGTAMWWGLSLMRSVKFESPTFGWMGWTVRYDYLNNSQNGGGTFGTVLVDGVQGKPTDPINGFGVGADCYAANAGAVGNCAGANRHALSLGLQFYPHKQLILKSELRYDYATQNTFYSVTDGNYRNSNTVFALQGVYSF